MPPETLFTGREKLFQYLQNVERECAEPDWDGYDSDPVDEAALKAARSVINAIPDHAPVPEIGVDPDGVISLDWYTSMSPVLSVSVERTGFLVYVSSMEQEKASGVERFDGEFPKKLLDIIGRITDSSE